MTLSFSEAAQLKTAILQGLTCPSITADLSQVNIDRKRYRPETVASGSGLYSTQDRGKLASKSIIFSSLIPSQCQFIIMSIHNTIGFDFCLSL